MLDLTYFSEEFSEIVYRDKTVGWICNINNEFGISVSGGVSKQKEIAYQIAKAEFLERSEVEQLWKDSKTQKEWLLDSYPSCSGFAFGFDDQKTFFRSAFEAVERWAWSKWIDEKVGFMKVIDYVPGKLEQTLLSCFSKVTFMKGSVTAKVNGENFNLCLYIVLGETEKGVFPGSRVTVNSDDNPFEHAVVESWRHFKIYTHRVESKSTFYNRISYFGENKSEAFKQIPKYNSDQVLTPFNLEFSKRKITSEGFLWRCLSKKYFCWSKGKVNRFVY